ncbi:Hsp20/alpha crystallin family protein [Fredinandcohnia sp. 179-A 10B2 NHS]|uniref:Hsp20/alpha crystallin family protein n=1 Tax=Fredinandcohnia sp. 179-A 10B2 NHS TaxID=3235176 RepID=UPI0039A33A49
MKEDNSQKPIKKYHTEPFGPLIRSMNEFFTQQPVKRLLDTIDEVFDKPFPFATIPIDMYETDTDLVISVDLPGVKKEQIDIEYAEKYVTISVNHMEEVEETNEKIHYYMKKHSYNKSSRTVSLPYPISNKNIKASYKDGVLKILIPKQHRKKLYIDE